MKISKEDVKRFLLSYQNLLPPRRLSGGEGILAFVRKVGCLQFDPLNIAGKNTDLVLQSRVKNYRPDMLYRLLYEDRKLLDGWDKNMSIYPIEDWPYFQRFREDAKDHIRRSEHIDEILEQIRKDIEVRGPLSSQDFDFDKKVGWYWAPAKASRAALESMYWWGELVVHHRAGTRKYYDLAGRHIPQDIFDRLDPNTTEEAYHRWHISRRIDSIGLFWSRSGDAWLGIKGLNSAKRTAAIEEMVRSGELIELEIEGFDYPVYTSSVNRELLDRSHESTGAPEASFIAPLDNLLWDRKFIKSLFQFEYTWEVYKRPQDRKYGYYVLPVLFGREFVARFEPVFDKKKRVLNIKNWWWEEGVVVTEDMKEAIRKCTDDFAGFLGAEKIAT
ncbi:MAG: winged helix-turn-helix domain-containing protein [Thermotogaceae bacterium]|nr:crosslink repair DNA glycosylase YcaQ family protein [Mesotoga sp.]NLX34724.1 winged helix-turn-helix domain-containing protein [Thermotogaceae bacterium]HPX22959.1 crosslink repair DNA glycosylase YcaQ family protein [Mesotoga sp.]HQC57307.1 crosslink repair DNA glycosylase YcaQ family protein [Mesotoga sp.]